VARTCGPIGNRLKRMPDKGWSRAFDEPIPLPRGRQLVTLEDAGNYITKEESKLAVNKITWAQVGLVTEPGRYMFKFGWLTITAEDLAIWKQFPDAGFTLYSMTIPRPADGTETEEQAGEEFRLGTFELGAASNYSESEK